MEKETLISSAKRSSVRNFRSLPTIGAIVLRFILCPGDDILAVSSVISMSTASPETKVAVLPRDEITEFMKQFKSLPENQSSF